MHHIKEKSIQFTRETAEQKKRIVVQAQLSNANLVEIVYVENIHSVYAWNVLSKYFILF